MAEAPVALVTGAARGIGAAIAAGLAEAGCDMAVFDIRPADETVAAVVKLGRRGLSVTGDITRAEERSAALERVEDEFGRLDVLVNNAGVAPKVRADITEASEESYDFVMGVNLKGPYFFTQAAGRGRQNRDRNR